MLKVKRVAVITLFPEMFSAVTQYGVTGRAIETGLLQLQMFNPRDFTEDKHQTVDDRPYGGGPGMVMRVGPLKKAVDQAECWIGQAKDPAEKARNTRARATRIYLTPQGKRLDKSGVASIGSHENLILVAGRYEGIDERFVTAEVDEEYSIGDYVLSGGELPAMVLLDAMIRRLPEALGDASSVTQDSFENGLLDFPHYTRPETLPTDMQAGNEVPQVLLSGDHAKIADWRIRQSVGRTWERRPDLIEKMREQGVFSPGHEVMLQDYLQAKK